MNATLLLEKLIAGKDLSSEEANWIMNGIMDGEIPKSQVAAILTALRIKGETITEIAECVRVMREKSTKINVNYDLLLDTCGTGGDRSGSFNISTTVALLLAGGGYKIAKHGNRSMTSQSGSADLLEALGVNINLTTDQVADCINQANIGFLFAPALHSAMKNVVPIRKELAIRTIFNILGPLTNPAGANVQVIGLFTAAFIRPIINVLKELGTKSAFVVSGEDGLDEVSITAPSKVARLHQGGKIEEFRFDPKDYAYPLATMDDIKGGTPQENAQITTEILKGVKKGATRDIVAINAGFAIAAAESCSLKEAFQKAKTMLDQGVGIVALEKLKQLSNSF